MFVFRATTHADLLLRAKERGIGTQVIHNASIMNAVGCCGLQVNYFGDLVIAENWIAMGSIHIQHLQFLCALLST